MKCPKCQSDNREGAAFCRTCGQWLSVERVCPRCTHPNPPDSRFCEACGQDLKEPSPSLDLARPGSGTPEFPAENLATGITIEGERKQATVLFSDLSGYTTMTEKLDPEEVKEIMGRIFGETAKVVAKYEGFIEKFIGDAVMAIFGASTTHEDDPVRAIKASREIHDVVSSLSFQYEKRIGRPLSMHTGICTGLVVTGEMNLEKGTHGVLGETIDIAARLSSLAQPGEIVTSPGTYHQAEGYFHFHALEPTMVKGKAGPVKPYKVLSPKEEPATTHRLSGSRAELIGRKVEMAQLQTALANLKEGKGSIFSLVGDAGTGKSRLIEDFKATINPEEAQWREGHAYAYSQNMPYFPLIDLLSRAWQIKDGDSPEQVRTKVETGAGSLIGDRSDLIPFLGGLYSLRYPEIEHVSPEYWKTKLYEAVQMILSALAGRDPVVICFEDLHWADPSSIELLRSILKDLRLPALFLCAYRPPFNLFAAHELAELGHVYQEMRLQDLSSSEAEAMVESLLRTDRIPSELQRFIQTKTEGNPFYLEEVINALIESETLVKDNGTWKLTRAISEANIPSTIQGVIAARLDGLERDMKRIIQEASVIGRAFLYEILKRVTALKDVIDKSLSGLERLELIRTRTIQPDLEYVFKHALTQEVVYSGLLKKERQALHERIGIIMEQLFRDRLPEFYETLAFHYKQGQSTSKAVDYLIKCGEKNLNRYSLDEAHQYFQEAFDILSNKEQRSREEDKLIVDLLFKWLLVYYYHGDWKGLTRLLLSHKELAESLDDKASLGRFYCCLGFVLFMRFRLRESYDYLHRALHLGEEADDRQVIGYAACWMSFTCATLGIMDQGIAFGEKAQEMAGFFPADHYLYFKSLGGIGWNYYLRGEGAKLSEIGKGLLKYGRQHSHIRCIVVGHISMAMSGGATGNVRLAIESGHMGAKIALDRFYRYWSGLFEATGYALAGQLPEAQKVFGEIASYSREYGCELLEAYSDAFLGAIDVAQGHMARGLATVEEATRRSEESGGKFPVIVTEFMLGRIYKQIAEGAGPVNPATIAKNIGFLVKNVPFAAKKAENHFQKAIGLAQEIGAKSLLGQVTLELGHLHKIKGKNDEARKCISDAVRLFEECEADAFLKQAREALAALG
jgi:class 3 adenylate cyclase/tetratricopeptide (TPR) repeat protein